MPSRRSSHAAGRGRAGRPRGGVLPLRRLQSLDGARAGPRRRRLQLLRHRLRRHGRRPAAGASPTADGAGRRGRGGVAGGRRGALVVCTGGEPLLQLDAALIEALHARGFEIAVETNGTLAAPAGLDWICVSPKADAALRADRGRRAEAGLSAGGRRPGATSRPSPSSASPCSPWTGPTPRPTRGGRGRLLPPPTRAGA